MHASSRATTSAKRLFNFWQVNYQRSWIYEYSLSQCSYIKVNKPLSGRGKQPGAMQRCSSFALAHEFGERRNKSLKDKFGCVFCGLVRLIWSSRWFLISRRACALLELTLRQKFYLLTKFCLDVVQIIGVSKGTHMGIVIRNYSKILLQHLM